MSDKSKPFAKEALRAQMFPGIAFRSEGFERRAWIIGTAHDVWQVIDAHRDFGSLKAMVAEGSSLSERQIQLALAYYERFPEEIDEAIALQRRPLAQLRAEYPFIKVYSPTKK